MLTSTSTGISTTTTAPASAPRKRRGFAAMDKDTQRKIASAGGKAAHAQGTAHEWTSDEARAAGMAGGAAVVAKRGVEHLAAIGKRGGARVSENREHMARIGRKGGEAVGKNRRYMQELGRRGGNARAQARKVEK